MEVFKSCGKCDNGIIRLDDNTVRECKCKTVWKKRQMLRIKLEKGNIPYIDFIQDFDLKEGYKGKDRFMNIPKVLKYVNDYKRYRSESLYFYGANGTQKTTVASWIACQLLNQGYTVEYITMKRLVDLLLPDYDRDRDSYKIVERLKRTDLLIIDEAFDKTKLAIYKSGYQLSFLDDFIRNRMQRYGESTLFVSNVDIEDIVANGFSISLQDLVKRSCTMNGAEFIFEDNYLDECSHFDIKSIFG